MANHIAAFLKKSKTGLYCFTLLSAFITSCQQQNVDQGLYSKDFKIIFDRVSRLFETYKVDQGLHYLDSASTKIHLTVNDQFRYYGFHYMYSKTVKNDNKKAALYADSMMMFAQKSINKKEYVSNYAEASFCRGDVYFDEQLFNEAYLSYYQGYLIGKNNLNNGAMSEYTYRMGMIMYKQGHYDLATRYFRVSLDKNTPKNNLFADFYRRQELMDNIGLSYKHSNKADSALMYFDMALKYIKESEPQFKSRNQMLDMAKGVVYGNKADVLIIKGDKAAAADLLKKSITYNLEKGNDNQDAEYSEIKLGDIYFEQHKIDTLFSLLKTIRLNLDSFKNETAEYDWNRLMSSYYAEKNDPAKALAYFKRYDLMKDSANAKLKLLKESDVEQQLANYEKQYQINSLKDNNKLQRVYLIVFAIGTFLALIIIFLVLKNALRSKRDVKKVRLLNEQIGSQKVSLENTLTELNKNGQEKDRILRNVAHDLRNPIGGIASLTGMMIDEDGYNAEQKGLLKLIKETANDTIELINEILEATTGKEGDIPKQMVEINSLLNNSIELMRFKAAEKDQRIIVESSIESEELYINREKIRRVISNLITNAIKFSPAASVIRVRLVDKGHDVEISVNDHGIGVPQKIKEKIFNMFTDAKRPGTMGEKSFGLGLSICRQIVEKHNGRIWCESDDEHGTTFFVSLAKAMYTMPANVGPVSPGVSALKN